MKLNINVGWIALLTLLTLPAVATASVPAPITYHGMLHNAQDQPVNATVTAVFKLYDAEDGGARAWEQTFSTIDVNDGEFSVELGDDSSAWATLFDGRDFWLDITIDGEKLEPRARLTSVPYALRAANATNADTLGGKSASDLIDDISARPTPAQNVTFDPGTSGLAASDVQAALLELAQLKSRINTLEAERANYAKTADLDAYAKTADVQTALNDYVKTTALADYVKTSALNTTLASYVKTSTLTTALADYVKTSTLNATLASYVKTSTLTTTLADYVKTTTLSTALASYVKTSELITMLADYASKSSVSALETKTAKMTRESVDGKDSIVFTGVNVHVRNGHTTKSTTTANGLGNLIIGYNEKPNGISSPQRAGSHNLVAGTGHQWSSYGGMVVGSHNTISARYAVVSGGVNNIASGEYSSVSGGDSNRAGGSISWVSGGGGNEATNTKSSVSGGVGNTATGSYSSVSGGRSRTAPNSYNWSAGTYASSN